MIWLLIILSLFLLLLCYLLIAPLVLDIDSTKGLLRFRYHYLASARLRVQDDIPFLDVRILGWKKSINLFAAPAQGKTSEQKATTTAKKRQNRGKRRRVPLAKLKAVLKSFRVRRCFVRVDSGNMQLNGMLYPLFLWLSMAAGLDVSINFCNRNEMIVKIDNNIARMLGAYLRA